MRIVHLLPLLIGACLLKGPLRAQAADWPGWRGLEQQGHARTAACPVTWSPTTNVSWKTAIPGRGHSSPIVVGDRVFVTTVFPATAGQWLRWTAVLIVAGLWLALTVGSLLANRRLAKSMSRAETIDAVFFLILLGLVAAAIVEIHLGYGDDRKCFYFRWLHSGAAFALCLGLASRNAAPRSVWRLMAGGAALLFAGCLALTRPDPTYYRLLDPATYSFLPTWIVLATIALTGAAIVWPALSPRIARIATPEAAPPAVRHPTWWLLAALLIGLLGFGVLPYLGLKKISWQLATAGQIWYPADLSGAWAHFRYLFDYGFYGSHVARALVACAFLIPLAAGLAVARPCRMKTGIFFAPAIVLVGALNFAAANFIGAKPKVVRAIVCLDRASGAIRWTCAGLPGGMEATHPDNSPATPTPLAHAGRVFAWFGTPGMLCCDGDGKLLWTNSDLPYRDIHGAGSSPVLADGLIVIDASMSRAPYLTALDPATGRRLWTTPFVPWPHSHGRYRTPTVAAWDPTTAVLTWGWYQYGFAAHAAHNGALLWEAPFRYTGGGEAVNSMLTDGDSLYACSAGGAQARSLSQMAQKREGLLWRTELKGRGPNTASPVLCNGLLFMVSDNGEATCLDARDGRLLWQERLPGRIWMSSPVAVGDRILFSNGDGATVVVAAERQFRILAENRLDAAIYASLAPADDQLFIRTTKDLWCIGPR